MHESRKPMRFAQTDGDAAASWSLMTVRPKAVLVAAGLAIMTVGVAMNWSALVAAGIAPLIITALPWAVMCALGLCMSRMGRSSCATETTQQRSAEATPPQVNAAQERIEGPQLSFDLHRACEPETANADQAEQEQERRPINA